jgi:hypothetical protein
VTKNSVAVLLSVSERAYFLHYKTASYVFEKEAVDYRTQIDFCGYISSIFCSSDQIPFFLVFGDVKISSNIVSAFLNGEYWAYDKMVFGSMIVSITILCIAADIYELFVHGGA